MIRILHFCLLLGFTLGISPEVSAETHIKTVAGNGTAGYSGDGKNGDAATLDNPFGVIVGLDGDIIFCDTMNHVIRRVSRKSGVIETIVGTGDVGYEGDGGDPLKAKLNEPYEVRFHPDGDLYWVERMSHTVRKLDSRTNVVATVAGIGGPGFSGDSGPANLAMLDMPHSIQFDASGDFLLICDIKNHRIRRVELASGVISTWCGNGKKAKTKDGAKVSSTTPLNGPRALDRDSHGDFWLALREGNQVYRIDVEEEKLYHVAGTGKKGFHAEGQPAAEALLSGPKGVAVSPDGKSIYLADTESHSIRVIDLSEEVPFVKLVGGTGSKGDGPDGPDPLLCQMNRPHGLGVDPINGDLYVGDSEAHKIRVISNSENVSRKKLSSYEVVEFELGGRSCRIAKPIKAAPGKPWIWRCRFWGAFPSVDEVLLAEGWHVGYVDVANEFGGPEAIAAFEKFYDAAVSRYGLSKKPIMEGFSRGGLPATNWSILHPERVSGIYLDSAVLDIHSWPKGKADAAWAKCLKAHQLTESNADAWEGPLSSLSRLIEARIPVMLVAGGADEVVPFQENTGIMEREFAESGGDITVIVKAASGHHPHSLHDPTPVVKWAKRVGH